MEFDGMIFKIQGALVSLGSQRILNNPDQIQAAISILREAIQDLPEDAKPKVTFFMVLNTQLTQSDILSNDNHVGIFVGATPFIQKDFLIDYLYELNLNEYLCQMIENCPVAVSSDLIEVVIKKYNDPNFHKDEYGISHLYRMLCSIFVKICKMEKGNHSWDAGMAKLVLHFRGVYEVIKKVLITTMKISCDNLIGFLGSHLFHFFKSILFCMNSVKKPGSEFLDDPIYKLSTKMPCEVQKDLNSMKHCVDFIFKTIDEILQNFTIDIWMSLSESYSDADKRNSFQVLIGNLIYEIYEDISNFSVSSEVLECFTALKIKPKEKCDLIAEADMNLIMANVDQGNAEWFKALARHPALAQKNAVTCLINNLHLADVEDINFILDLSLDFMRANEESPLLDSMRNLFLAAVKKTEDCPELVEKVFQDHQPNLMNTSLTQDQLVETFNKISSENKVPVGDLLSLCVQAPLETLKKICHVAVYDRNQLEFCVEVLSVLRPACKVSLPSERATRLDFVLLKSLLQEISGRERETFVFFVGKLAREKLLSVTFVETLLRIVKEELENRTLEMAVFCLEVLRAVLQSEAFSLDKVVFLVFMSSVLDHLSWDVRSFCPIKADGKILAGEIVSSTLKDLKCQDALKLNWARTEIEKCWEINQAYFHDLFLQTGRGRMGSRKLHSHLLTLVHAHQKTQIFKALTQETRKYEGVKNSLVLALITLFPVLTFPECSSIFIHLTAILRETDPGNKDADVHHDVLDMFGSALYFLTANLEGDEKIRSCYEQCLRNFGRLVQLHTPRLEGKSASGVLKRIFSFLKVIEDDGMRRSCSLILSPVLLMLVDRTKETESAEVHRTEIQKLVAFVDVGEVAEAVARRFG